MRRRFRLRVMSHPAHAPAAVPKSTAATIVNHHTVPDWAADYDAFRAAQPRLRAQGVYRGIGISGYVEGTAIGPYEGATVKLDLTGRATVATGAVSSGQGHETSFAQVAADALGIPLEWVTVIGGDTAAVAFGVGTFASRSAVTAGNSIADACRQVRDKLARAAATLLEAAPADIEIDNGMAAVRGAPATALPLARVIQASLPTFARPGVPPAQAWSSGYYGCCWVPVRS